MHGKLKACLVTIAVFQCACLCMILVGITGGFEASSNSNGNSESHFQENHNEVRPGNFSSPNAEDSVSTPAEEMPEKVVLVVIDALRLDFISEENFPFMIGTLGKYQRTSVMKFDVKVDSPTVTLPRVKTIVTGRAPTYLDVLRNFQTEGGLSGPLGLNQPNLISSLRKEIPDANLCFFGDETWLRLFPAEDESYSPYFKKWEGVTSFYVRDFYEVDNNITRHLEDIDECNWLILHYLGLDHIGHVHGPKQTRLLKNKLLEMDNVIKHLHSHLSNLKTKKSKSLILVTGDHGMANVGGHGGSSYEEILTPLISIVIGGMPLHRSKFESTQINQIDIAPTLAALWNIGIPQESRGQLILDLIEQFKSTDQLANSYQKNCKHLLSILGNSRKAATYNLWWKEISKMDKPLAIKKYIELEQELSSTLQNSKSRNSDFLCNFVISMAVLVCAEIYLFSFLKTFIGKNGLYGLILVFLPSLITYFSSSFIEEEHYIRYYLFPSVLIIYVLRNHGWKTSCILSASAILVLHRIATTFNQTGDKWSHLADLNDYIAERQLDWVTGSLAVILIYAFSPKTARCSRSFKAAMLSVYLTKIVSIHFEEAVRENIHWMFADSKLQKVTLILIFFHLIHHLHNYHGCARQTIMSSASMFLLYLHRWSNFIVFSIVFVQLNLLETIIDKPLQQPSETSREEKNYKSSSRTNNFLSRMLIIWFAHAAFYYQGNSNGLATVDVTAGYTGIESYSSNFLIGSLILMNTYSCPLLIFLFMAKRRWSQAEVMNGSVVRSHMGNGPKVKQKERTKKATIDSLPVLLLLSNGAECIVYSCTLVIFQNHLFIWSVFVPKLLYLISQSLVCAISCIFMHL